MEPPRLEEKCRFIAQSLRPSCVPKAQGLRFSMDRSALLSQCHKLLASKSATDSEAAIALLDSEDLKGDASVS